MTDAWVLHGHAEPSTRVTDPPEHKGMLGGRAAVGCHGHLYAQSPWFNSLRASCCYSGAVLQICRGLVRIAVVIHNRVSHATGLSLNI